MDQITCLLPGGYVDEAGGVHRHVELSSLNGREEEFLANNGHLSGAALVTGILSRCVRRIGDLQPVVDDMARSLLVADRQYLLLKLREATFGDRVQATIRCPWPECGARIDIEFSTREVPVRGSMDKGPCYEMQLSPEAALVGEDGEVHREVVFRLPNGSDQETLSPILSNNGDESRASMMLLGRCVQRIGPYDVPGEELIGRLAATARTEIEGQMEAMAPHVELTMEGDCPECGREFAIPCDLEGFFLGELRTSSDLLYREAHYLAYHYHWSEREIMEMPREKRRRYIEILAEEIARLNDAVG
jgi:hypothetical protein